MRVTLEGVDNGITQKLTRISKSDKMAQAKARISP